MTVDVAFKNAKVYNLQDRFDVVKGEPFTLFTDFPEARWFSDNDNVLSIIPNKSNADFTADNIGTSTVIIMSDALVSQKVITVNVVASVEDPASNLNASSGKPIPKE